MILHPVIHAEILANTNANPSMMAPPAQTGSSGGKRSIFNIDRNHMTLSMYGMKSGAETLVAQAKSVPRPGTSQSNYMTWVGDSELGESHGVAPGVYTPHAHSVSSPIEGMPQSVMRMAYYNGIADIGISQIPADILGAPTPDSSVFDGQLWHGLADCDFWGANELWPSRVSYNGLRRMPFNTCGMQATILAAGVTPTRFELTQSRLAVFNTWYYDNFIENATPASVSAYAQYGVIILSTVGCPILKIISVRNNGVYVEFSTVFRSDSHQVEIDLSEPSNSKFDIQYVSGEPDFVPTGPFEVVKDPLIYSGLVGFEGSGAELVFADMNWNEGDTIAIPEIVLEHKSNLEVVRYVG